MSNRDRLIISCLWLIALLLLTIAGMWLKIRQLDIEKKALENRPPIVYQADSYSGMTGKVMAKGNDGDSYYVDIKGYGRFLISKEQFDNIVVGEDVPKEIWKRGS